MRYKDESKITLIGENMDILIGEILNMAVTYSGCPKLVCGESKIGLWRYLAQLLLSNFTLK